jgi:hypothetical protein
MTNGLVPLTIRLFIGLAFVQLPPFGSSDTETVADTSCFEKRPFVTAPVMTEVILPPATFMAAVPAQDDVFALLHLMVIASFIELAFPSDAHVSVLAGAIVPFAVPLATPGVPVQPFSGSFRVNAFAAGALLSPGETAALDCPIVQLRPVAAPQGAASTTPSPIASATTDAKATHRSHSLPP